MARTKGTVRRPIYRPRESEADFQMSQFEKQIRKYYPKKSRFFYKGSHCQADQADHFKNPNSLVPQRYSRDFFRSFYAHLAVRAPEPTKIPQNLQLLKILSGSEIVLRKLIKQNRRLKHLFLESSDGNLNLRVVRNLKYSKSLLSITFKREFPYFSMRECQKMLKSWGGTLEIFQSCESVSDGYHDNSESFKRVMETILKLPKLKMFQFLGQTDNYVEDIPFDKLQERNIAYKVAPCNCVCKSLVERFPQFKPVGNFVIGFGYQKSQKMTLETQKFQKRFRQTLSFDFKRPLGINYPHSLVLTLLPIFENISSLDLSVSERYWEYSSLGKLNNLKHLSVEISQEGERNKFGNFFNYLHENVANHKQLETFLIKAEFEGGEEEEEDEENTDAILHFFEACSQSLRTVYFEFNYRDANSEDAEYFYEGLSKLKNLQSLSLCLDFGAIKAHKIVEGLCHKISEFKSLEELDFRIRNNSHQGKELNLKFPTQLKKLSLGMDTSAAPFDSSKTILPISNLLHLELEFLDFSSSKWSKLLHDMTKELTKLQVLVLKQTQKLKKDNEILLMKERIDELMKESLNLNLTVFANIQSEEMMVYRRKGCPWSHINPIVDDISFGKNMRIRSIKSYQ